MLVQVYNPVTGEAEWAADDTDGEGTMVGRAFYTDMLMDTERNTLYNNAIRYAVEELIAEGRDPVVLDIGTGTGLLGMMAARAGAKRVIGCELYEPIARIAKKCAEKNGFEEQIRVVPLRSNQLHVAGEDGERRGDDVLPGPVDLVVTEIFDTELLGEGMLPTMTHAIDQLCSPAVRVVPGGATVYARVVQSEVLRRYRDTSKFGGGDCRGGNVVLNLQLSQLEWDLVPLTDVFPVLDFDFTKKTAKGRASFTVPVLEGVSGRCDAVVFWWTLHGAGGATMSTAPGGQWRDHWMQNAYLDPSGTVVDGAPGETLEVRSCHDEYSIWFDVGRDPQALPPQRDMGPEECTCRLHHALTPTRIYMVNSPNLYDPLEVLFATVVASKEGPVHLLDIGDGSVVAPWLARCCGVATVHSLETSPQGTEAARAVYDIRADDTEGVVIVNSTPERLDQVGMDLPEFDIVFGEPFYPSGQGLQWENLRFWYARHKIASALAPGVVTMPARGRLMGVVVELAELWKSHAELGEVEGFDHQPFDDVHHGYQEDMPVLPYAMWQYDYRALSEEFELMTFDFAQPPADGVGTVHAKVVEGRCHGVVLWMDWDMDAAATVTWSGGPSSKGTTPSHSKQGVKFIPYTNVSAEHTVMVTSYFTSGYGQVDVDVDIRPPGATQE